MQHIFALAAAAASAISAQAALYNVTMRVTNMAPVNGAVLTPM